MQLRPRMFGWPSESRLRLYASQVVANACTLKKTLFEIRIGVITLGTDTPLIGLQNFQLI